MGVGLHDCLQGGPTSRFHGSFEGSRWILGSGPKFTCNHSVILYFSFLGLDQEISSYLVSGGNFRCVLHHLLSLNRWNGSRGQVWPENDRKIPKLKLYLLPLGLFATKLTLPEVVPGSLDGLSYDFRVCVRMGNRTAVGPCRRATISTGNPPQTL